MNHTCGDQLENFSLERKNQLDETKVFENTNTYLLFKYKDNYQLLSIQRVALEAKQLRLYPKPPTERNN